MRLWRVLSKLENLGVDPMLPRQETKHIVLTNRIALLYAFILTLIWTSPTARANHAIVSYLILGAAVGAVLVPVINAMRAHVAASSWLIVSSTLASALSAMNEPAGTRAYLFFMVNGLVAWFVFAAAHWRLSVLASAGCVALLATLPTLQRRWPATAPQGFDVELVGELNTLVIAGLSIGVCVYAAREMARVERELLQERERSEGRLKRELSHQVAERSRELGEALARTDAPLPAATLAPGARFHARYRVVQALGEGGMGAVYEVERLDDGERLALKVVTGTSSASAVRFAREAEIGARVRHGNLVPIIDVGIAEGGTPFLVMELLRGGSLEPKRASFGDVPWALPILRQVARGLLALHDAGVVHRDLKPANVLLGVDGVARISDFGISRFGPWDASASGRDIDVEARTLAARTPAGRELTATGTLLGTPLYMAPEAAQGGRELTSAADVFAFGILAHEMLTGASPFNAPPLHLALAKVPIPVPPAIDDPRVDGAIRATILDCLAEEPRRRPSARALVAAFG